jgi:NCS1 nucleoside transporter family
MNKLHDNINATQEYERTIGLFKTIFIWLSGTLVIPTIMIGQIFVPDLSPIVAMQIVLFASLLGSITLSLIAAIGTRTGLPTFIYARTVFGVFGAKYFAILNIILLLGWGAIQGYLGGIALNQILLTFFNIDNIVLSVLVTQGTVLLIALLGHKGIEKVESIVSCVMLVLSLVVIYYLLDNNSISDIKNITLSESPKLSIAIVFDIVLATAFSWMALPCDYNRYCKSVKVSVFGISIGYMIGTIIAMGLGILVGSISIISGFEPTYDPAAILSNEFAIFASLVMFFSVVTTNVMAVYSITMSTMSLSIKFIFSKVVIFFGIIVSLLSLLQDILMTLFYDWILLVGIFMIPVFSIVLVDYYILKKQNIPEIKLINLNIPSIIAYIVSVILSLYFTYMNPLKFGETVLTFVFAGILYFILVKSIFNK